MKAFTLEADLKLNTSGFSESLGAVEGQLNSEGSLAGFAAWGTTIGNLASSAFRKTFSAGVQFAKDVVNKTMDFESAISAVESVTQASASDMDAIKNKARELGGSTIYTAQEVAEAMFYMGQAGWDTEKILAGIGPVMDLAAASGDDLSRVSDIVTDSLTAFGLSASDTQHFVDVLAQTARNSNTDVTKMGEAFKYVAPVAGMLGYSVDDVGTALGTMANNGIKSSMAGTALRTILTTMIGPSDDARKAMEALGVSLLDSNGRVKSFSEVMGEFRKAYEESGFDLAGKSLEEVAAKTEELAQAREDAQKKFEAGKMSEKEYASVMAQTQTELENFLGTNAKFLENLTDIGGLRGIAALLSIMKATDDDYTNLTQQIEESTGAAAEMAAVQRDNLKGDLTLLQSTVDDLQLTIGEQLNEPLRNMTQNATEFVKGINEALKAGQGKLDTDAMSRIMEKYNEWNNTSNLQFITKSNRAAELYKTVASELEAAGASAEEIQNVISAMEQTGNASQLLDYIKKLQSAQQETNELKAAATDAAGDYDINFHITTTGSVPNPNGYVPSGGVGGSGKNTTVSLNAKGAWNIPYDNYPALLHRNEMVLNETKARKYRDGESESTGLTASDIASAVRGAVLGLAMEMNGETVGRVFGDATTHRVNRNIAQINRRHQYGYGG